MELSTMEPMIRLRDVRHAFGEGSARKEVLHGVSAELHPGEIVILTGPSGSGKTTILTLAGALRTVQHGSVVAFGEELRGATPDVQLAVRRRIGFIFQQPNLLEALTAAENVQLALSWSQPIGREEARARALRELEAVGLADRADRHPSQMSGGQRQRVAVARALVVKPRLILADEPTSALDRTTGREVVELLQTLARRDGCAILLVTHDHRILDIADRHLALEDGRLVSLAREASRHTDSVLAGLAQANRTDDLTRQVAALDEPAFFAFLAESTEELAQFCRMMTSGRQQLATSMLDRLLVATTFKGGQWLEAERVTLYLVDWKTGMLRSRVAQTQGGGLLNLEVSLASGVAGHVARTGAVMNLADAYESPLFNREVDRTTGYRTRSLLAVPLKDESGSVYAVAQVLNKRDGGVFSADDVDRFQAFLEPMGRLLREVLATEAALAASE